MPKLDGILETCIHTTDMARAKAFYEGVLELQPIYSDSRLTAYAVAGHDVLLVFQKGATSETVHLPGGGVIPGHAGDGTLHVAFAIGKDQLAAWEERLTAKALRSKARTPGRAAAAASTSAIPTGTCWSSRRPGCGQCTRAGPHSASIS